ncbi:MAG: 23S rRNA (pseudouridine(1915)-N(3))-methyltransferase RlmH [Eubacteriaceae bacterium]
MNIRIITVGKLKEKYLTMAQDEYAKRLKNYCRLEIIEVKDEKIPENASVSDQKKAIAEEGKRILRTLKPDELLGTLEINGQSLDSLSFSKKIENYGIQGKSQITFVIGGSLGLSQDVLDLSSWSISFSKMTFPHQLFRIMLLEQIYRSFKIIRHETYHK